MGFRITILISFASVAYLSLLGNLYSLQINQSAYSLTGRSAYATSAVSIERGQIFFTDRDNDDIAVAINRQYPTIFADTRKTANSAETASALSKILGLSETDLLKALKKPNTAYQPLKKRASSEEIKLVKEAKLPGIYVEYDLSRYYPFGNLGSHLLGFVSQDAAAMNKSLYGAELYYDAKLTDADKGKGELEGEDLHLTIDRNIQAQSEAILRELVKKYSGTGGTVIVQEPKTGKILALASYPAFDPNNYSDYPIKDFLNPAIQTIYEPGSIVKLITMAAGIDSGAITPSTPFFDSGEVTLNTKTIRNADKKKYGSITMTDVIEHSVNTGAVFAQRKMGNQVFYNYLQKFGFNNKTGIDLPGEIAGGLRSLEKNSRDINFATASFGQGLSVTPISLINAISTLANGGLMMKPYVNAEKSPQVIGRVVSQEAADKVTKMMVSAVVENKIARIEGYNVAGKTGTAQVPDFVNGGYTKEVINTYAGFAPATDPRFVILMRLDKPEGSPQAGQTIVPAWRELAKYILNYYKVPPDNLNQK